jgi:hypothetical protein
LRKSILIVLALALLAGIASAKLGDLSASFPNVGTSTHYGLAADANYLYSFYYYSTWQYPVIRMRRSNGAFVSSYPCPLGTASYEYYGRGMSYDGTGNIYFANYYQRFVARFNAANGSVLSTWTWPTTMGYRYALCVDHKGTSAGTYIYQSYYTGDFFKSRLTGSLVSSWSMPYYTYDYDQAWDYGNDLIWCMNYSTDWVLGIEPDTQKLLYSFRHPEQAAISSCYGIAYWGEYLYISNSGGTPDEYIWVFHCPNDLGVRPASVGKIKALFE